MFSANAGRAATPGPPALEQAPDAPPPDDEGDLVGRGGVPPGLAELRAQPGKAGDELVRITPDVGVVRADEVADRRAPFSFPC
ncbi:hypothetical protein GCM10022247_73720 [Allokutzneria multivorans]|uniref:Uncharacterized protein n=1 Tax=Allokutzneria multivorans TaxID=1142134 RepID=A0ABP7U705_9PSEU